MAEGWVLLIEPKSHLGQGLSDKLAGQSIKTFNSSLSATIEPPRPNEAVNTLFFKG
jgi:hypothetical protein